MGPLEPFTYISSLNSDGFGDTGAPLVSHGEDDKINVSRVKDILVQIL